VLQREEPDAASRSRSSRSTDAFGRERRPCVRPDSICNPVDKNGEGIGDATAHLECYRREAARVAHALGRREQPVRRAATFAPRSRARVCVPSETDGVASALDLDDFACAKATRPSPRFARRTGDARRSLRDEDDRSSEAGHGLHGRST
jgi:hypothetical protein